MGSRSKSSSATSNYDNRVAVQDGIGLSASNNNLIQITDGGIVRDSLEFSGFTVDRALDSVDLSTAAVSKGFDQLIATAENLFNRGEGLIGQTQKAVADAYSQAQTDAKSTIDNRTITVLAVAGVAAVWALNRKK